MCDAVVVFFLFVVFVKQKTAYEMRISDWSSDVCSSDLVSIDPIWHGLRTDAESIAREEPALASFLHATVLAHDTLEHALAYHLSQKLASPSITGLSLRPTIDQAIQGDPEHGQQVSADLSPVFKRPPALSRYLAPSLHFKGYQAPPAHRSV